MPAVYISLFILGLIVGSFANVLIYRIPRGEGFISGRSKCSQCGKVLKWPDLIPLLSFVILQARCRYCQGKISWRYPLVELYSGVVFLAPFVFLPQFGLADKMMSIFVLEILLVLFTIDLKHLILPDSVIIFGLAGAVLFGLAGRAGLVDSGFTIISLANLTAAVSFSVILFAVWLISHGRWLGLGDSKLMLFIGLFFGLVGGVVIFYLAVVLGGIAGLLLLLSKKARPETKLPLGSFICLAASVYILLGYDIINKVGLSDNIINIFK